MRVPETKGLMTEGLLSLHPERSYLCSPLKVSAQSVCCPDPPQSGNP